MRLTPAARVEESIRDGDPAGFGFVSDEAYCFDDRFSVLMEASAREPIADRRWAHFQCAGYIPIRGILGQVLYPEIAQRRYQVAEGLRAHGLPSVQACPARHWTPEREGMAPGHVRAILLSNRRQKVSGRPVGQALSVAMHTTQILTLLLALSGAVNVAFTTGITARVAGASVAQAILAGAGSAGTVLAIFFAAVSAYR